MKFVHAADLHVDSPLKGLERYDGAPVQRCRLATRQALENLVRICIEEEADFLLIAGDLFDHDWKDFSTPLFVASQLQQLDRHGIPVYLIFGNHDAREEMSRKAPWPKNVHPFLDDKAATQRLAHPDGDVALHGLSFRTRQFTDNPLPKFPAPLRGALNIGLLHTSCGGNAAHETYAPCSVDELCAKGYDYWALGHVHNRETLCHAPHVVFPGNTQGRHIREDKEKGCIVVDVQGGRIHELTFRPTDVLRWHRLTIPLDSDADTSDLIDLADQKLAELRDASGDRLAAVRLRIEGACRAHRELTQESRRDETIAELRLRANAYHDGLWLEKIEFATRPLYDLDQLRRGADLVGQLLRDLHELADDPQALAELGTEKDLPLAKLAAKVQSELADGYDSAGEVPELLDPARLAGWLQEAELLLVESLVDGRQNCS